MTTRTKARQHRYREALLLSVVLLVAACSRGDMAAGPCADCSTVRIAAVREPPFVLPPLVQETVGRDIGDRVYQRLARLRPGASTIDRAGFEPDLARSWEPVDSLTWRFRLDRSARWHDGKPVTPADVVFSFAAYTDTSHWGASPALAGVRAEIDGEDAVLIRFPTGYPEQLYDATWHVRVLPAHIWSSQPASAWASDTAVARLVGSGPYRVSSWERGQSLTLVADSSRAAVPSIQRLVWRFVPDPEAAVTLLLSREADLVEQVGPPAAIERVRKDSSLRLYSYPSAVYGFAAFQLAERKGRSTAFIDRRVRQALTLGVDRVTLAHSIFGPGAVVPPGPVSRLQWIGSDDVTVLPFDTARAEALLDEAGWISGRDGLRMRNGVPLSFSILVPSTSGSRRLAGEVLQAAWKRLGASAELDVVDFPVFQQRLAEGKFDIYVGAYLDEPSPRGMVDQWGRPGWEALNYGHYANPGIDSLVSSALAAREFPRAKVLWHEALDSLNADAPAVFLYGPEQVAAASQRIKGVVINPWSWLEGIESWTVDAR